MTEFVQITSTSDQSHTLEQIARDLVQRKLAACVQISGPVTSIYRWQGQVEQASEWICHIKTARQHVDAIVKRIDELHHYETPEIIVTPISGGSPDYLHWIRDQVDADSDS